MLQVKSFYARSFSLDEVFIFWEIEDIIKEDDIYAYEFTLLKSEAYYGPYDVVVGPFQNLFLFRDTTNLEDHKNRNIYYKLKIVDKRNQEAILVGPTAQLAEPDLLALEIQRQEDIMFRNFIGRKCYVFPRKTFGQKCICVDYRLQRKVSSNCKTCYDVGYLGGFNNPVICYIQFDPNTRAAQLTPSITHTINFTKCRLLSFPPLMPGDLIVESENMRWRVIEVAVTRRLNYDLHQEVQVKELLKGDIEYYVPINDDIKKIAEICDRRNFTNPTTFEYEPKPNYEGKKPDGLV